MGPQRLLDPTRRDTSDPDDPRTPPNLSDFIHDAPIALPTKALLNPIMVSVSVCDGEGGERASFTILRALLCAKSAYFEKTFMGEFVESEKKEVELPDVAPWVMEIFVGWLYSGRVCFDPADGETSKGVGQKRKREDGGDGIARQVAPRLTADEMSDRPLSQAHVVPPVVPAFAGEIKNVQTIEKAQTIKKFEVPTVDTASLEDPTAWRWEVLFQLYIFADQYDTRRLRMQLLDLIQLKLLMVWPCKYANPNPQNTKLATDRLPSSSPLRRLLVDYWARGLIAPKKISLEFFVDLPQDFLAECLVASKAHTAAVKCKGGDYCGYRFDGRQPHTLEDVNTVYEMCPCAYHEHPRSEDVSEEELRCTERWKYLHWEFCSFEHEDDSDAPGDMHD